MKIIFNKSIKNQIDEIIDKYNFGDIKEIVLSREEYIQFLEEICPTTKILLGIPGRFYRDIHLEIVP